jgi:hypothetical protein
MISITVIAVSRAFHNDVEIGIIEELTPAKDGHSKKTKRTFIIKCLCEFGDRLDRKGEVAIILRESN